MMKDIPSNKTAQLAELMFLRDVVIPYMRQPNTLVDLGMYEEETPCGTYRCMLGWYTDARHGKRVFEWVRDAGKAYFGFREIELVRDVFGEEAYSALFDVESVSGSLEDRARRLDELIAERMVG